MKIVVCVKEVPDTETHIKIDQDQKSIDEGNITFVMNPYDEYAIEEALKLHDTVGVETTAICIGTERANEVLRTAVAMGIDNAIRIENETNIIDGLTIAKMLAQVLKDIECDLLLLGKEAIDDVWESVEDWGLEQLDSVDAILTYVDTVGIDVGLPLLGQVAASLLQKAVVAWAQDAARFL